MVLETAGGGTETADEGGGGGQVSKGRCSCVGRSSGEKSVEGGGG